MELQYTALRTDAALEGYYRMNSGALTTDSSGNSRTLTNTNTVGEGNIKFGGAADFSATNTNKTLHVANAMDIDGGACSLSLWVKLQAEIGSGSWGFVGQTNATSKVRYEIVYEYNAGTRRLSFQRVKNNVAAQATTYTITLGTTTVYHLVLTYDTTNIRGYVNSVLQAPATAVSGSGATTGASCFVIGAGQDGSNTATVFTNFSSILADDVAVFSKALSQAEITQLYQSGSNIMEF